MKRQLLCLLSLLSFCLPAMAELKNESELGFASANGNTKTLSLSVKQNNDYSFDSNVIGFKARYLNGKANGVENARYFMTGLRYERELGGQFNVFAGETFEKDKFADIDKRWSTDVGGKYKIIDTEKSKFFTELGYRYKHENRIAGPFNSGNYIRNYNEWENKWTPTFSTKYWLELLPNLSNTNDWQYNTELSMMAAINSVFSMQLSSGIRYDHEPAPGIRYKTESLFTSALVAKF